jgi:NAD(P)-dependent dehydrogenase (short-subunit alcohol dehydrogenase family)
MKEAMTCGVRCSVIRPGFTDTPMVRAIRNILPYTQLGRLIQPAEIADAICFMLANAASRPIRTALHGNLDGERDANLLSDSRI